MRLFTHITAPLREPPVILCSFSFYRDFSFPITGILLETISKFRKGKLNFVHAWLRSP